MCCCKTRYCWVAIGWSSDVVFCASLPCPSVPEIAGGIRLRRMAGEPQAENRTVDCKQVRRTLSRRHHRPTTPATSRIGLGSSGHFRTRPELEHGHDTARVAAAIAARIRKPLVVLGEEGGSLEVAITQVHHVLAHGEVVLHIQRGRVRVVIRQHDLLLLGAAALLHRLHGGLLLGLAAVLGLLGRLGRGGLVGVVNCVLCNLLQPGRARPVPICRRADHAGKRLAQLLELPGHILLYVDAEVVAVGDGRRLEHEPQLRLLEVLGGHRRLLAHQPGELR
mmetsp:Transcript_20573/g.66664  ORF Transcript_20573/g.66664 Transcript_20573/m.66664 type:complete len:279 (+) Transcript_20573:330-1166(+)